MNTNAMRGVIWVGLVIVNIPVIMLVFGSLILSAGLLPLLGATPVTCSIFPIGWALAWAWWSFSIPRWRLWALRRVDNINELRISARVLQLEWPKGHFFERTEIRPRTYNLQERELEVRYCLGRLARAATGTRTAQVAQLCGQALDLMGPRDFPVGYNPAVGKKIEALIEAIDADGVTLADLAWPGGMIPLSRLLHDYLNLMNLSH